jgi:hypothetical protein
MKTTILILFAAILFSCSKQDNIQPSCNCQTLSSQPIPLLQDTHYVAPSHGYVNVQLNGCMGIYLTNVTTGLFMPESDNSAHFFVAKGDEYFFKTNCLDIGISAYFIPL